MYNIAPGIPDPGFAPSLWSRCHWNAPSEDRTEARKMIIQIVADQQLERCVDWLTENGYRAVDAGRMRTAMRPKPPSPKQQALEALELLSKESATGKGVDTILRALESLPD